MSRLSPIIVDRREKTPAPEVTVSRLRALGCSAVVGELPVGDFLWTVTPDVGSPTRVIVERKTLSDLMGSLPPSERITRFIDETGGAVASSGVTRAVLLEGDLTPVGHGREWTPEALDNLFVSMQQLGILLLHSQGVSSTPGRIVSFWDYTGREHKTLTQVVRPQPEGSYLNPDKKEAVRLLMALPGLGETKARAVLAHFGSLNAALRAFEARDANAFKGVPGVSKGLVMKAADLLDRGFA